MDILPVTAAPLPLERNAARLKRQAKCDAMNWS